MTDPNPTDIFNDFKNGKIDSSSTIRKLILMSRDPINDKPRHEITDILLEMYRTAETKELKKFMVEELGKEFMIYFDLTDPREGLGLRLLEIDTAKEVSTDSGASQHYVDFSIKNGHVDVLYVCQVVVSNTKILQFFPHLRALSFYSQCITRIEGLEHLKKLEILELTDNGLDEINGLENLINLKELDLSYNRFNQISGLEHLINLKKLDLSYNQLKEINGLEYLQNLEELHLVENDITEIKGLKKLANLKILDIDD